MDGSPNAAAASGLVCEAPATWSVSHDGSRVRLGLADRAGEACRIDLPVEATSVLLLALPRTVHPLGDRQLEGAAGQRKSIPTPGTSEGFNAAFARAPDQLAAMAEAGRDYLHASLAPRALN